MKCAYDDACEGAVQPLWIRSVGIPLCRRHESAVRTARTFEQGTDPRSFELLAAAAVAVLRGELAGREPTAA